jgi:hypothetical protein
MQQVSDSRVGFSKKKQPRPAINFKRHDSLNACCMCVLQLFVSTTLNRSTENGDKNADFQMQINDFLININNVQCRVNRLANHTLERDGRPRAPPPTRETLEANRSRKITARRPVGTWARETDHSLEDQSHFGRLQLTIRKRSKGPSSCERDHWCIRGGGYSCRQVNWASRLAAAGRVGCACRRNEEGCHSCASE